MVDYRAPAKSLNNELLFYFWRVLHCNFHYSLLDDKHLLRNLIFLAQKTVFFVKFSIHTVNDLLFCLELKLAEVVNLVTSHFQEDLDFVVVETNLLFEHFHDIFK